MTFNIVRHGSGGLCHKQAPSISLLFAFFLACLCDADTHNPPPLRSPALLSQGNYQGLPPSSSWEAPFRVVRKTLEGASQRCYRSLPSGQHSQVVVRFLFACLCNAEHAQPITTALPYRVVRNTTPTGRLRCSLVSFWACLCDAEHPQPTTTASPCRGPRTQHHGTVRVSCSWLQGQAAVHSRKERHC